jgi:hypothetical protein
MGIRTCAAAGVLATGLLVLSAGPAAAAIDLECGDFPDQASAQVVLESNPDDPNGLDPDADGWACEDFDYATSGAQVTTAPVGGVATGDGSTATPDTPVLPFVAGGLGLVAAGAAGLAARRSARGSA